MSRQEQLLTTQSGAEFSNRLFAWVLSTCAMVTPMMLIVYAFASSLASMERAQIIVHGLVSTVFTLVLAIASRWVYHLAVKYGTLERRTNTRPVEHSAAT